MAELKLLLLCLMDVEPLCTYSAVMPCYKPLHNAMQRSDLLVILEDLLSQ
jgi:hypothetical protein